jgi:SAM-dependent methyltransferase
MKLSNIVQYLNHLDTLSVRDAIDESMAKVASITHVVRANEIQIDGVTTDLQLIQEDLKTSLQAYDLKLKKLRQDILTLIQQREPEYFANSTDLYQQGIHQESPDHTINRTRQVESEINQLLINRLITHTNWQHPGMVLRPAHSLGLDSLVALDPLYLVDTHENLLSPLRSLFSSEYQRRLRYYVIEEYPSTAIFWNLPQQQFGLVYAFHYFDFKPWEILQRYLDEIFVLLRPGGVFLFSFNNCDNWRAVGRTENYFCCYTPGRLIHSYVQTLGYEIVNIHNESNGHSWIELRKPGVLDSIRGAQVLAGIRNISNTNHETVIESVPKSIDKSLIDLYNELNLDMLIELARVLNVDISQDKTKREFNIKKVRRTISAYLESQKYPEEYLRTLFNQRKNK